MDEFRIEISPSLIPDLIEGEDNIISFIKTKRMRMLEDFNVRLPKVHVVDTEHLKGDEYIMLVEEKRVREGVLKSGEKLTEMNSIISDVMRGHFQ